MNEDITVSDMGRSGRRLKRPSGRALLIVLAIIIGALVGMGGYFYYQSTIPALIIGDTKISKAQYKNLVGQAKALKVEEPQAKDTIISYERRRIVAKSANISIDQTDVDALLKDGDANGANEWQKLVAYQSVFDNNVQLMKDPGFKAAIYYFPFSKHFDISGGQKPTDPKFNDQKVIDEDKAYAKELATDYKQKIIDKKITPEKAIEEIKANDRLVYGTSRNNSNLVSLSGQGNVPLDGTRTYDMTYLGILPYVEKLKVGQASEMQTRKSVPSYQPNSQGTGKIDTAYVFAYLIQDNRDQKNDSSKIEKLLKAVKVKNNV